MPKTKKVVSTRLISKELAKARDGLIQAGIPNDQCNSISNILRLTFYYGISMLCEDPESPPSNESLTFVKQKMSGNKQKQGITLTDILK